MTKKSLKVFEVFSGIGAQRKALDLIEKENDKYSFQHVGICEWNAYALIAYGLIHKNVTYALDNKNKKKNLQELSLDFSKTTSEERIRKSLTKKEIKELERVLSFKNVYTNLTKLQPKEFKEMPRLDILQYSFPCQSLSMASNVNKLSLGMEKGSKGKSSVVWELERIFIKLSNNHLPKCLIMENVSSILHKKHKKDFIKWLKALEEIGYENHVFTLNGLQVGIPHHRRRTFAISYLNKKKSPQKSLLKHDIYFEKFEKLHTKSILYKYNKPNDGYEKLDLFLKVDKKHLIEAKSAQPKNTISRKKAYMESPKLYLLNDFSKFLKGKKFKNKNEYLKNALEELNHHYRKPIINNQSKSMYCRTITTKQDRSPCAGVIDFDTKKNHFRFLTPRECFLLMGFNNNDYNKVSSVILKENIKYTLVGNSMIVPMIKMVISVVVNSF